MGTFTPSNADGMDFSFETFNADMKMQPTQTASPDSTYFTNMAPTEASTTNMPNVMPDGSTMPAQQPRIPNKNAPLDESHVVQTVTSAKDTKTTETTTK